MYFIVYFRQRKTFFSFYGIIFMFIFTHHLTLIAMTHEFICSKCNEHKTHESSISTGYATTKQGEKICFDCMRQIDLDELCYLKKGEKYCLYLTKNNGKYQVTNWPGTLKIDLGYVREGKHNFAGKRYDFWFTLGQFSFHGVNYGDNTEVCHIRKVNN